MERGDRLVILVSPDVRFVKWRPAPRGHRPDPVLPLFSVPITNTRPVFVHPKHKKRGKRLVSKNYREGSKC